MAGMMIVCRPEFSFDDGIDAEVLDPAKEGFVPVALRQVALEGVGEDGRQGEPVAIDAVTLVLAHHLGHLALQLVDGAERAVEAGERVVAALVEGASEAGPGVVVLHLDMGPADGAADGRAAFEEAGVARRVVDDGSRGLDAKGSMDVVEKPRRGVFAVEKPWSGSDVFHFYKSARY